MSASKKSKADLLKENEELQIRLAEAEDTLRAIREGEVDAVIVSGTRGEQIFSLVGTDSIYRLIVETMKEAAFTVTFDGTILFCNAQFGQLVKRPLEVIVGHPLQEFVAEGNRAAASSLLVAAQQEPVKQRLVFQDINCTSVPVHVSANVLNQPDGLSICVVASDLTELENSTELIQQLRRQQDALQVANEGLAATEEELRVQNDELAASRAELDQTRARYQDLFETAPDGYLVTDPEGTIQEVNQAAAHLLGRPAAQLRGNQFSSLLPSAHKEDYHQLLASLNADPSPQPKWEVEIRPLAGSPFWADVTAAASCDDDGRIVGLRWLIRDITARKRAEVSLEEAAEELKRSNRDLEAFAYVASHDLQEPLRMICGFAALLTQNYKGKLDAKADECIAFMSDGASRMSALIKDLLEYSRVGSKGKKPAAVALGAVVDGVTANLRVAIKESNAAITVKSLPTVMADAGQMRQLFQNLIGNALKFRVAGRRPKIHVGARQEGGQWAFYIKDNGIGIAPEQHDRVFVIFQRLHGQGKYPGTGIGLAICKKIVERHGGRIWLESTPGEGTTFWFTLPADVR